ncbi:MULTISPECIES: MFS transporter [unclassified Pantoea]|uniref:MFS transporter n=1 Tax=unclassified Pantoea TaxID=2630326 RepID=UPI001CD7C1CC|nr:MULTISPECIES: MFS transporter [unclassified Pantoea]MCA1177537.1 MFS transporter [Pantoea sp. alder69]MCA1249557.1 MFS transporter [Pantoea sp. alder70]MCA1266026.1 MFS transporter [Pantoea sp. alder81]
MSTSATLPQVTPEMQRKTLIGAVAGNLVEFLDFALYGLLASVISRIFFPQDAPLTALLSVLLLYASSFLVRPIGGIVLGLAGDRWGRRSVLMITITGMSVVTGLTALLPTYAQAGTTATVLLVICRLIQGFFAGGEYATATDYIVENSNQKRRAFRASFSPIGAYIGTVIAIGLYTLLSSLITAAQMEEWGWRVLFAIGFPLGLVGLLIRRKLDESPEFLAVERARIEQRLNPPTVTKVIRSQWKNILVFMSILMSHTLPNYLILGFFATYLTTFVGLAKTDAAMAVLVSQFVLIFSTLLHGYLSDVVGRKRWLLLGCVLVIPAMFFAFTYAEHGTLGSAIIAAVVPVLVFPMVTSGMTISLVDMFPAEMRASAGAMAYNTGTALFGGTAPLIGAALIGWSGSAFTLVYYVAAVAIVSFISIALFFRYPQRTATQANQLESAAPLGDLISERARR